MGEPGVGKSELLKNFSNSNAESNDVLEGTIVLLDNRTVKLEC
jgi:predicted ATP-dependent serine protease